MCYVQLLQKRPHILKIRIQLRAALFKREKNSSMKELPNTKHQKLNLDVWCT
jgi:hypothetical protein